jgi:hypothetical protein
MTSKLRFDSCRLGRLSSALDTRRTRVRPENIESLASQKEGVTSDSAAEIKRAPHLPLPKFRNEIANCGVRLFPPRPFVRIAPTSVSVLVRAGKATLHTLIGDLHNLIVVGSD